MIWYLLYPVRGTTKAPVLDQDHPLRYAFTRYGFNAARHPLITLFISFIVAVALIFPFPFFYTNDFTNGTSNLPHHVWTSAEPFQGPATTSIDVVMRSFWVHGSYMKALQTNVLYNALEIQNYLLGPTVNFAPQQSAKAFSQNSMAELTMEMRDRLHAINGLSNQSWFFHSPLQYWSCSVKIIEADEDILATINHNSRKATSVNTTLRHSIVFSGKRFEEHRLVAADALVITLVHMLESPVGRQWEIKAEELAMAKSDKWRLYPADGKSLASTLYEFRFQPLSFKDDLILGVVYIFTLTYLILSLSKLRAFKSRIGLIIAVIIQVGTSIVASFTVCAVFKIDLSKIPREAYPLVVLAVGMENISRFISAVVVTRSEVSTATRLGEALGKISHIALAGVGQNLAILWLLSRGTYPQITAFCTFAAIALIFDFFFLLTFFSAILSVDLQRMELNEALSKASSHNILMQMPIERLSRLTSIYTILKRILPLFSRIAGTIFLIGFALMAHWHFFDNESIYQVISHIAGQTLSHSSSTSLLSMDIHPARTPTAWIRMQDHETAHEVIQIIKPHANSIIARVYDPLIFVLDGSDRTPNESGVRPFLPAAYDFVKNQFGYFLFTFSMAVAALFLFLNYLLWDEFTDSEKRNQSNKEPLLSITTLSEGHALDIVLLVTSIDGILVTVGLDRRIWIWNLHNLELSYVIYDREKPLNVFPILALAIDNDSKWLAILSAQDRLFLWSIPERKWGPSMQVILHSRTPIGFFFGASKSGLISPLIIMRKKGSVSELHVQDQIENHILQNQSPFVFTCQFVEKSLMDSNLALQFLLVSKNGSINTISRIRNEWVSKSIDLPHLKNDTGVFSIQPLPVLTSILVIREYTVDLVDISTQGIIYTFSTRKIQRNTLKCFYSVRRRQCGLVGLRSLAIAYNCAETGNCIMQIYLPRSGNDCIYLKEINSSCCLLREAAVARYEIKNPGQWETLQSGFLIGIRKRDSSSSITRSLSILKSDSNFRRRNVSSPSSHLSCSQKPYLDQESWEVWSISSQGEQYTQPLSDLFKKRDFLLVDRLGPLKVISRHGIAVGLGNTIKIISVGKENFKGVHDSNDDSFFQELGASRMMRRKKLLFTKKKPPLIKAS
ncbi:Sterol regulatory element-binding protein cleavage-activating protein [Erysiphe necator]|nr:Sterol regulatory element-binding protein cleavage-activating protein [Erysiphe necator]